MRPEDSTNKVEKGFWKGITSVCITIIYYHLEKWGGVKRSEHSISAIFFAAILMLLSVGGLFGAGFKYIPKLISVFFENGVGNELTASVSNNGIVKNNTETSIIQRSTESLQCDLDKDLWELWLGDIVQDVREPSYFSLPQKSTQGLFKYKSNIENISNCEFSFIPRGEGSINYVISFDGVYQIVIGDNDYWTISLRASDSIGGALNPIKEDKVQKTRPRLVSPIKKGTPVKITLNQGFTESGKYRVFIKINYRMDKIDSNAVHEEVFSWIFSPNPTLELYPTDLSIGLIRAKDDQRNVGVTFIYPNPVLQKR